MWCLKVISFYDVVLFDPVILLLIHEDEENGYGSCLQQHWEVSHDMVMSTTNVFDEMTQRNMTL